MRNPLFYSSNKQAYSLSQRKTLFHPSKTLDAKTTLWSESCKSCQDHEFLTYPTKHAGIWKTPGGGSPNSISQNLVKMSSFLSVSDAEKDHWIFHINLLSNNLDRLVAKSCPTLVPSWTVAHQIPLSMGFSRQEYWSGLPFTSQADGIKPGSPELQADSLPTELQGKPSNNLTKFIYSNNFSLDVIGFL